MISPSIVTAARKTSHTASSILPLARNRRRSPRCQRACTAPQACRRKWSSRPVVPQSRQWYWIRNTSIPKRTTPMSKRLQDRFTRAVRNKATMTMNTRTARNGFTTRPKLDDRLAIRVSRSPRRRIEIGIEDIRAGLHSRVLNLKAAGPAPAQPAGQFRADYRRGLECKIGPSPRSADDPG